MTKAAERALRRHLREKATIDRLVKGVRKTPSPAADRPQESPRTSTGLSVEDQVRKKWDKGGLPIFWRDPPAFLLSPPRPPGRVRGRT
jgi:hypothetical protein